MVGKNVERKRRIEIIRNLVYNATVKNDNTISEEQLICQLGLEWGAARRTILEYLRDLEMTGQIRRDLGMIFIEEKAIKEKVEEEVDEVIKSMSEAPKIENQTKLEEDIE